MLDSVEVLLGLNIVISRLGRVELVDGSPLRPHVRSRLQQGTALMFASPDVTPSDNKQLCRCTLNGEKD